LWSYRHPHISFFVLSSPLSERCFSKPFRQTSHRPHSLPAPPLRRVLFGWLSPLVQQGERAPLTPADVWQIHPRDGARPPLPAPERTDFARFEIVQEIL